MSTLVAILLAWHLLSKKDERETMEHRMTRAAEIKVKHFLDQGFVVAEDRANVKELTNGKTTVKVDCWGRCQWLSEVAAGSDSHQASS